MEAHERQRALDPDTLAPTDLHPPSFVVNPRSPSEPAPAERTNFLGPAEQPGELGRLSGYRILDTLG